MCKFVSNPLTVAFPPNALSAVLSVLSQGMELNTTARTVFQVSVFICLILLHASHPTALPPSSVLQMSFFITQIIFPSVMLSFLNPSGVLPAL